MTGLFGGLVPAQDGHWVSNNFARLAEIITDFDPHLELRWIPPEYRTRDDGKPYVVWDSVSDTPVVYAGEMEEPYNVLATVFQADAEKNGHVLDRMAAVESAYKISRIKEYAEQMEQAADQAKFMLKSPLNVLNMNGKKYDDQRRVIGTSVERKHIT